MEADWRGVLLVGLAAGLWLCGTLFYFTWLEGVSLLPCLAGLCLLLGGGRVLKWVWPGIVFLFFMLPLPFRLETSLAQPLQRLATEASTIALVLLGYPATAEGNIISLYENKIGVAEACGGLSMLLTFVALAAACALVIDRPLVDKIVILLSAVPIALCANVVRITLTGVLYEAVDGDVARLFFHDLAGWFMMAFAVAQFWIILKVLSRMFVTPALEERERPLPLVFAAASK
jgi:exosortase